MTCAPNCKLPQHLGQSRSVWRCHRRREPLETQDLTLQMLSGETIGYDLTSIVSGGQPPHAFTSASATLSQGTVSIEESGLLSYTASSDASGSETFSYEVTDGLGLPAAQVTSAAVSTGVVTISIVQPLVINPVALTAVPGTTQTFDLNLAISGGLPPFSFILLTQPAQGSASITPDGMLTFTANAGATGTDTMSFQVTDSFEESVVSSTATIPGTIDVTYVEELPTATATALEPLPPNPNATSTATPTPEGNAQPPTTASGGGVTQLTSTGSGTRIRHRPSCWRCWRWSSCVSPDCRCAAYAILAEPDWRRGDLA